MGSMSAPHFGNLTLTCFLIPPKTNSHGIDFHIHDPANILTYSLPLLELQIGVIFAFSHTIHYILKRTGASLFSSCIVAGIVLGPTFLGKYDIMKTTIFPADSQDIISSLALFSFSMFLFLSAVKMDVGMILTTGETALSIGIASVMVPLIFGLAYKKFTENESTNQEELHGSLVTMIMTSLTSFPVTAYLVGDQLKISNSELGRLGLSSALVADILGMFTTIAIDVFKRVDFASMIGFVLPILCFILVLTLILRPAMFWVIRQTPEGKPVDIFYVNIILVLAFLSEVYFHWLGLYRFLGPFIFGLAVPSGAPLGSVLVDKFAPFTFGVLSQILITTSMMRADIGLVITQFSKLKVFMCIICITYAVKMLAVLTPSLLSKIPLIDSMALSLIMNYKGIVELCRLIVFRDTQIVSEQVFALASLSIFFSSTIIPILVKRLYDPSRKYAGYKPRNVMSLKPRSELRILTCIHRPDSVYSITRLLEVLHPTRDNPLTVFVLHLIKLVGRSTPILISHSKQRPISNSSQTVIHAFSQYEKNNWGVVSVHPFTAISPSHLIHEDICTLALDKLVSFILIPLHRKWSIHGMIESGDRNLRALNFKVLEKAPCSVGIFFDRGRLGRQRQTKEQNWTPSLCVIFLGGSDDREALSLAKRMANKSNAILAVVHFIADHNAKRRGSEDEMLDDVVLEDVKQIASSNDCVEYKAFVVRGGQETLAIIRDMENEYDLFLMGRRHGITSPQTADLAEWSEMPDLNIIELPELGIIGDFFASKDLNTKASVLVVQQQRKFKQLE